MTTTKQYDAQGRRIRKRVWDNTTFDGNLIVDQRFVYDGWNMVAVLAPDSSLLTSFLWGLDLSGSLQGAGGVGGLLFVTQHSTPQPSTHFVAYDGNGNVMALVQATDGTESARYEYGPFGEPIRGKGAVAEANPFRFSTKFTDDETDLLYYGYRFYNPSMGRWPNRDPIGEEAFFIHYVEGKPLEEVLALSQQALWPEFVFLRNAPVALVDGLGLKPDSSNPISVRIPDCSIQIFAGHGLSNDYFDDDGNWRNPAKKPHALTLIHVPAFLRGNPACSAGTIIACNARWFASISNPLPGTELADTGFKVIHGIQMIDKAVNAANGHATTICKNCCKCKEVTITVHCRNPFHRKPTSANCGKTFIVTCP